MATAAPLSTPFVSVLMSCYNASRWLDESIQSVLNQSYGNFEFIIVNDGSTDCTQAIIQHYASSDDRIVMIEKANTGLADSLNVGISRARGVWIARQDADDISDLTRLEKQVRSAMINHNIVFLGTGLAEIDGLEAGHDPPQRLQVPLCPLERAEEGILVEAAPGEDDRNRAAEGGMGDVEMPAVVRGAGGRTDVLEHTAAFGERGARRFDRAIVDGTTRPSGKALQEEGG